MFAYWLEYDVRFRQRIVREKIETSGCFGKDGIKYLPDDVHQDLFQRTVNAVESNDFDASSREVPAAIHIVSIEPIGEVQLRMYQLNLSNDNTGHGTTIVAAENEERAMALAKLAYPNNIYEQPSELPAKPANTTPPGVIAHYYTED